MLLSQRFYFQFRQVLGITMVWILIGWLDILNSFSILQLHHYETDFSYTPYLIFSSISMFFSGLIAGSLLVFYLRKWGRRITFGAAVFLNSLILAVIDFLITFLLHQAAVQFFDRSFVLTPGIDAAFTAVNPFLEQRLLIRNFFFWLILSLITVLALNINEKYGPGILLKLILGKYHRPTEEERIFLFMDLRGSTTMAESLGHLRFHQLLNDYFSDITVPILDSKGEIYQYVGDMIVVTWPMELGLKNARCVHCFYKAQAKILKEAPKYRERYGLVPEFKAGIHSGLVTTGEIGFIKRDIVYSGDVLNTTSRIQDICNKFRVKILLSKHLLDKLSLPPGDFLPKRMGVIELKGKKQKIELYTFEESTENQQLPDVLATELERG